MNECCENYMEINFHKRACKIVFKMLTDGLIKLLRLLHVMRKRNFEQEIK
jgi:hypothetical protein